MMKITIEEVENRLKNRDIIMKNSYINMGTRSIFKCLKCEHEWEAKTSAVLNGNKTGCPKCAGLLRTTKDVINDIKDKPFSFIDEYRGSTIRYKFKCNCGNIFTDTYHNAKIRKTGCGKCKKITIKDNEKLFTKSSRKTYNEFLRILEENNYELRSEYINATTIVLIKCKKHKCEWETYPKYIIQNHGKCKKCIEELRKIEKTNKQEKLFLNKINKDNLIDIIGKFKGLENLTRFKCLACGNEWDTKPIYYYYFNSRCPKCKASKGESAIINYLENNNIKYEHEFSFDDFAGKRNRHYRFDFAILGKRNGVKALIEYDGIMHYKKKRKGQDLLDCMERDNKKSEYAKKHKIKLIRIPYWEFDNIEKILERELKEVV